MSTVVVIFLLCALGGVTVCVLGGERLREGMARVDAQVNEAIERDL